MPATDDFHCGRLKYSNALHLTGHALPSQRPELDPLSNRYQIAFSRRRLAACPVEIYNKCDERNRTRAPASLILYSEVEISYLEAAGAPLN